MWLIRGETCCSLGSDKSLCSERFEMGLNQKQREQYNEILGLTNGG